MLETAYPSGKERTLWEQLLGSDREKQKNAQSWDQLSNHISQFQQYFRDETVTPKK